MFFKKKLTFLIAVSVLMLMTGCDFFKSHKVSSREINAAASWSDKDQYPTFPQCEGLDAASQKDCFESTLKEMVESGLVSRQFQSLTAINEQIVLSLVVDKEGLFSLETVSISNALEEALPDLSITLNAIVENLPRAIPAVKTNVEENVTARFSIPIEINAQVGNSNAL